MSELRKKKNLNRKIAEMERHAPKPKPLLTEKIRAKFNAPYNLKIKEKIKEAKKDA